MLDLDLGNLLEKKLNELISKWGKEEITKHIKDLLEKWAEVMDEMERPSQKDDFSSIKTVCENILSELKIFFETESGQNNKEIFLPESFLKQFSIVFEKVDNLSSKMLHSQKSGKVGEEFVYELIQENFPSLIIEDTHSKPHSGDFLISFPGIPDLKILVEIKNYKGCVSQKEVDKFKYDIEYTKSNGGILFSINSKISKKRRFEIEFENEPYCLYCSQTGYEPFGYIASLMLFEEIYKTKNAKYTIEKIQFIFEKIMSALNPLQKMFQQLFEQRKSIEDMQKIMNQILIRTYEWEFLLRNVFKNIECEIKNINNSGSDGGGTQTRSEKTVNLEKTWKKINKMAFSDTVIKYKDAINDYIFGSIDEIIIQETKIHLLNKAKQKIGWFQLQKTKLNLFLESIQANITIQDTTNWKRIQEFIYEG